MANRKQMPGEPNHQQEESSHEALAPPGSREAKLHEPAALTGSSDQDFSQRPGFGGYGPDGAGYGSQSSYGSHNNYRSPDDSSAHPQADGEAAIHRSGAGTTSSHTGSGTQTPDTATGASHGSTFGGATTVPEESSRSEANHTDTPSRDPGSSSGLAGRCVSSSSTTITKRD